MSFGGFGGVPRKGGGPKNKQGPLGPIDKPKAAPKVGEPGGIGVTGSKPIHHKSFHQGEIGEKQGMDVKVGRTIATKYEQIPFSGPPGSKGWWRRWNSREEFDKAKAAGNVGVRWVGPMFDESGYGEACRNYVAALQLSGMPMSARSVTFGEPQVDYGKPGRVVKRCLNLQVPCSIQVTYSPPPNFPDLVDENVYNIGMFVWEMQALPQEWVLLCNRMDEIWVPCTWNAEVAKASGVHRPIHVFGHTASPDEYQNIQPLRISNIDPSWYKFYSVFQWTERKNPAGLLRTYLKTFSQSDPVVLILKTYGQRYTKDEDQKVRAEIDRIRAEVGGNQPKIALVTQMLSKDQILQLHRLGDCFVLFHRAEGWGLPHFEACMMGKPVLTTGYSGNLDFTKAEHSYLVDSAQVQNSGMEWFKWYTPDMTWADPNPETCSRLMRHIFENRAEAAEKGAAARRFVVDRFDWKVVGPAMRARLQEIIAGL